MNPELTQTWSIEKLKSKLNDIDESPRVIANLKPAAVLVLLVPSKFGLELVLTRRSKNLKNHPGQISFPGGKFEVNDKHLIQTAIRETHEEIGLPYHQSTILGGFPGSETISHFHVTPVVAYSTYNGPWEIDHNEVEEVIQIPLDWILKSENWRKEQGIFLNKKHPYYVCWWSNNLIWGATAKLLSNFRTLIQSTK